VHLTWCHPRHGEFDRFGTGGQQQRIEWPRGAVGKPYRAGTGID
jgi:hypothetical protein